MEAWMYESSHRGSCKLVFLRGVRNATAVELLSISLVLTYCSLTKHANNTNGSFKTTGNKFDVILTVHRR
jgi:hypothetical protein